MKRNILYITCLFLILLGISCSDTIPVSKETSEKPVLFPDYADVTIPYNIAPLNFKIENPHAEAFAVLKFGEEKIQVKEKGGQFYLPASDWRKLLKRATGKAIQVKLYAKEKEWLAYPEFDEKDSRLTEIQHMAATFTDAQQDFLLGIMRLMQKNGDEDKK